MTASRTLRFREAHKSADVLTCEFAVNGAVVHRGFNPDMPPHLNKVTETV